MHAHPDLILQKCGVSPDQKERMIKMLISWIENKLSQKLFEKKQEVIRLRWQKAQMERELERMKAAAVERDKM